MHIPLVTALALVAQCSPSVAPETMLSVVQVESGFDPLVIGVNGSSRTTLSPTSVSDAVAKASSLIASGRNIDLGLAQINSRNLGWLGLSVADAFDPCRNLEAAARVLEKGYSAEDAARLGVQPALRAALSRYNSGSPTRGVENGYVARVTGAAAAVVPSIQVASTARPGRSTPATDTNASDHSPPSWDVFGGSASNSFVLHIPTPSEGDSN